MAQSHLLIHIARGGRHSISITIVVVYISRAITHRLILIDEFCCVVWRFVGFVPVDLRSQFGLCGVMSDICQAALRGTVVFVESHCAWWPQWRLNSDLVQLHDVQLADLLMFWKDCIQSRRLASRCSARVSPLRFHFFYSLYLSIAQIVEYIPVERSNTFY